MAKKSEAVSTVADMTRHLESGDLKNVYLFYGEEEYLKDFYIGKLCGYLSEASSGDIIRFDGKVKASEVQSACETMPMFGGNTVVLVRDSGIFKSAGKGTDNDFSFLVDIPEDSYVIFRENDVDKRNKNFKIASDCGIEFECRYQKENVIIKILARQAALMNRNISAAAASLMITGIGPELVRLINEVNKLALLVDEGGTIEPSHVREACELSLGAKIFDLTDGIAENNKEKALTMLQVLLEDKMPPPRIMDSIGRQFMQLYNVKCMLDRGMNKNDIAAALSLHSFVAAKLIKQSKMYTRSLLSERIGLVADMDMRVKSGTIDPVRALELIVEGV